MGCNFILFTLLSFCVIQNSASRQPCSSDFECKNSNFTLPIGLCLNYTYQNDNHLTIIFSGFLFSFGVADIFLGHWYIATIQILFGIWIFVSYVANILIYVYFKPYPDTWHTHRRYSNVCCVCCSQHSIITLIYFIWWIVDLSVFSIGTYTTTAYCG